MKKKRFFFDIDNTLLCWPSGVIPDSAMYAIQKLKEQGHGVALATGRIQSDAATYAAKVGVTDFIADGGHSVTVNNELKFMEGMDLEVCKKFLAQADKLGIPWAVTHENVPKRHTPYQCLNERMTTWDYFETIIDPELKFSSLDVIYKMYLYVTEEEEKKLQLDHMGLGHVRYGEHCILYEPMDKAKGIKFIMDYYQEPYEAVVTFGDGRNDVPMFLPDWYNVAMGNARPELIEVASYVTKSCCEDGILHACLEHGWIER